MGNPYRILAVREPDPPKSKPPWSQAQWGRAGMVATFFWISSFPFIFYGRFFHIGFICWCVFTFAVCFCIAGKERAAEREWNKVT